MDVAVDDANQIRTRSKQWTFRVLAVLLGLSPFLILEAGLRISGWQPTIPVRDPFVDFQSVRPLFVADDDEQMMVTANDRLEYFRPESFAIEKDPDEYRIVCIGGSTVQGRPYAIETSFTTWLELTLQAADSSRRWNVINCGGVSYASYRLVPIVEEMLGYEPNLIILYTGHNEFLEDRSYKFAKKSPAFVSHTYTQLSRLKGLQYFDQWVAQDPKASSARTDKPVLFTEVDALLDYRGGLQSYHRNPEWRQTVIEHFEVNLRRMIDLSDRAGVQFVMVDPTANLRDCPPFKSEHAANLSTAESELLQQLVANSIEASATNRNHAIVLLEQAIEIDPHHAGIHFRLASHYDESNRDHKARHHFQSALEEDVCPLRIIQPLNQVIQRVAMETETPCVEIRRKFEELSDGAIPGDNLFFDHVHPSFHGHQVIAFEIAKTLMAIGTVQSKGSWEAQRHQLFDQHWKSLDPVYFERGKQRLDALTTWTKGRSEKLR